MSDQSSQPPDYWAITRRIAEARKTRRATNRQTLEAAARRRVPRTPAAQLAEARETRLRAAVDAAIKEALRKQLPAVVAAQFTETVPTVPLAESAPVVPEKPLHEMSLEEFRKAVAEAPKNLPQMLTELSETAPAPVAVAPVVPEKPLHDMTPEEFRTVADQVWSQQGAAMHSPAWQQRRPMTISELIARGYEDDGGA